MVKIFLSIIIPVYNGSKKINRCLNSIWEQGLDESIYEVICVDDCSTDNTIKVIKQVQSSHSNLCLLTNPVNKRAGGSRNYGVKEANGEYIVFIDADDYFHSGALQVVLNVLDTKLDILVCDFARHSIDKPNDNLVHQFRSEEIMSGREFMIINGLPYAPWKYVFKRKLMIDNKCYFEEGVSCEDVDWSHKIAFFAKTMQYKPILLTHYVLESNSQTASEFNNVIAVKNRILSGYRIMHLLSLCNNKEEGNYIKRVAESIYKRGILYFNGLTTSPIKKKRIITQYIILKRSSGLLGFAIKFPTFYSYISSIISPIFIILIKSKRYFNTR